MPIIDMQNISFSYDQEENFVVDNVDLYVNKGEFVAVLGHNGSGKSTLAKLMNVLYTPTKGKILICGMDTKGDVEAWEIRKHAGMIFQNPDNQIVATVVQEDVAFGLENTGVPTDEMKILVKDALKDVNMLEFAKSAPHLLSGGQKQRIAIAGVIAMMPDVLICDEATAMLDPIGRKEIINTVRKLNKEKGITVIWITHFMEEAAMADRVVVLSEGKIFLDGKPSEVFSKVDKIKEVGLDIPPMAELAYNLKSNNVQLGDNILTVDEMFKELSKLLCQ
ncbi:MAG: energy-coupling factor transporter ATPase [Christensenellaceae bacterium]|nr:energy-coupling factor transporter ATPase [Christensenellaceae bacterium]